MTSTFASEDELNEYRATHKLGRLIIAAQAVCDRWDSHDGASDEHIKTLRKALEDAKK